MKIEIVNYNFQWLENTKKSAQPILDSLSCNLPARLAVLASRQSQGKPLAIDAQKPPKNEKRPTPLLSCESKKRGKALVPTASSEFGSPEPAYRQAGVKVGWDAWIRTRNR